MPRDRIAVFSELFRWHGFAPAGQAEATKSFLSASPSRVSAGHSVGTVSRMSLSPIAMARTTGSVEMGARVGHGGSRAKLTPLRRRMERLAALAHRVQSTYEQDADSGGSLELGAVLPPGKHQAVERVVGALGAATAMSEQGRDEVKPEADQASRSPNGGDDDNTKQVEGEAGQGGGDDDDYSDDDFEDEERAEGREPEQAKTEPEQAKTDVRVDVGTLRDQVADLLGGVVEQIVGRVGGVGAEEHGQPSQPEADREDDTVLVEDDIDDQEVARALRLRLAPNTEPEGQQTSDSPPDGHYLPRPVLPTSQSYLRGGGGDGITVYRHSTRAIRHRRAQPAPPHESTRLQWPFP
mmetsp:Transcript_30176/g.71000  ORF Transcript_30176/g.71000 Transcript_30176/m.71000 type:complete len:352 (-) Transcript_30176:745-1800(-)